MSSSTTEYTAENVLTFLVQAGKLNLDELAEDMKKAEKKKILDEHPYPIWQGASNGRWYTYVKADGAKRKQIVKSSKEKLEDAVIAFYCSERKKKKEEKLTLEKLYPKWCEYKVLHGAASSYMKRIENAWKSYYAGTEIVTLPIKDLNKMTLDLWVHKLIAATGRSKKAFYAASVIMRQCFDYAVDCGYVQENIFSKVKVDIKQVFNPEKKKDSATQVFTREEVQQLFAAAWDDFYSEHNTVQKLAPLAVIFQFLTGLRLCELCCVRYDDIFGEEIYINRMYRFSDKEVIEYLKGHHAGRYVPLTSEAKQVIDAARKFQQAHGLNDSGYIFSINEDPLSYFAVSKLYTRYCNKLDTIHKSSHKSRKTFVSSLIDGKVNINTIREVVGHADERTTYHNYCFDRSSKSERAKLIEAALK